jgi:hypothetical protein
MTTDTVTETLTSAASGATSSVGQTILITAETLLPVLVQALLAGSAATTPAGTLIALVAEVLPPLIQSFGATSSQIQELMTALVTSINKNQALIDAAAAARGIPVQTVP